MNSGTHKRLLSAKDAACYLSISRAKLYEWTKDERIKSIRIDSRRLFDIVDLDAFIESLKEQNN